MGAQGPLLIFHEDQHERSLQVLQKHLGCLPPGQIAALLEMAQVLASEAHMTEAKTAFQLNFATSRTVLLTSTGLPIVSVFDSIVPCSAVHQKLSQPWASVYLDKKKHKPLYLLLMFRPS